MVSMIGDKYNALNHLGGMAANPNMNYATFTGIVTTGYDKVCGETKRYLGMNRER